MIALSRACKIAFIDGTESVGENEAIRSVRSGIMRPLGLGMLYGLSASPCATPLLWQYWQLLSSRISRQEYLARYSLPVGFDSICRAVCVKIQL